MPSQLFALVIGIDKYKSGAIWDLDSCVSDARRMSRWLTSDLAVPKPNICMLLDNEATLQNIETAFVNHLAQNDAIHRGDAILIYFAGHGSFVRASTGTFGGTFSTRDVHVLCPFDHDTKTSQGRVAGLSDLSLKAMLKELSLAKGDNVTLAVDSCFSPPSNIRDRGHIRWTPTRATVEDFRASTWKGAHQDMNDAAGFYSDKITTHTLLAACRPDEKAVAGKEGGRFTSAFLDAARAIPLHQATYDAFTKKMDEMIGSDEQHPLCLGNTSRLVFNSAPFSPSEAYHPVTLHDEKRLRVEAGWEHGIFKGHQFSIHSHNVSGQKNPPLANVVVGEIHPTWCLVHRKSSNNISLPSECWALPKPPNPLSRSSTIISARSTSLLQRICAALRRWQVPICGNNTHERTANHRISEKAQLTEEPVYGC